MAGKGRVRACIVFCNVHDVMLDLWCPLLRCYLSYMWLAVSAAACVGLLGL
jgi:hypothetical protein